MEQPLRRLQGEEQSAAPIPIRRGLWPEESGYQDALMPADTPLLPNPWAALGRRVEKTESR